ncbi:CPBP family intramembrane glutamic endopeptidase [Xiamenia xianingshaonis]|uniref:CPBP family intramembrane metalloprotease n=1 Tax=Xiamenia xianingshaonis TaxID=2682776 RepID=A0ABX0IJF9_9ACTN|nr:type II CAAX endopeptidase family protein [Xiamenia xianingshaonis]NHM13590.1 CPBP family intramembrane metalloprotease [Xiamenia xianingshaonis]
MKRILVFVAITFALTWAYEFVVVYPLVEGDLSQVPSMVVTLAIGTAMFFPAIGVVLTRLVTREGFRNCVIKPYPWRKSLPWFALAWFGPSALIILGAVIYFLVFPGDFDPQSTQFAAMLERQMADAGAPAELPSIAMLAVVQILTGVFLGPLMNIVTTFGEEWGWRGYFVPKLARRMGIVPTLLVSGIIWGLWHAPLTVLGHNYGVGYPGWPITGIFAMCVFCIAIGIFLSYVTIRTGSCLAATFGHGALNSLVGASTIFAVAGVSPFVGPSPTGIIGGCGFIMVAVIMLVDLRRRERDGALRVPTAGADDEEGGFCPRETRGSCG